MFAVYLQVVDPVVKLFYINVVNGVTIQAFRAIQVYI